MTSINAWIKKQKLEHLGCRDLGHAWLPWTARKVPQGYERQLYCSVCESFKRQLMDKTGGILTTYISYAPGYAKPKGMGRAKQGERATYRVASLKRFS